MAGSGRLNSRRQVSVDFLVRLDFVQARERIDAEVEERLPADEPARRAVPAREIGGIGAGLRRVEDQREEGLPVVALHVRPVRRPHHAVPEAVGGALELHGDLRLADGWCVEGAPVREHVVDQRLTDEQRQELVHDHPLVVPAREGARLLEHRRGRTRRWNALHVVDGVVVEQQERGVQPRDDDVLVIATVADDRGVAGVAREVLEEAAALDLELDPPARRVVELRASGRPRAVHRVEVEVRVAAVHRSADRERRPQGRHEVERHVVVHELTHERRTRGVGRVVRVVDAQRGIDDQLARRIGDGQRILRVEQTARCAELEERGLHLWRRVGERREVEQPREPVDGRRRRGRRRRGQRVADERHRRRHGGHDGARAERGEKVATTRSGRAIRLLPAPRLHPCLPGRHPPPRSRVAWTFERAASSCAAGAQVRSGVLSAGASVGSAPLGSG